MRSTGCLAFLIAEALLHAPNKLLGHELELSCIDRVNTVQPDDEIILWRVVTNPHWKQSQ